MERDVVETCSNFFFLCCDVVMLWCRDDVLSDAECNASFWEVSLCCTLYLNVLLRAELVTDMRFTLLCFTMLELI